jgi:hypothetical protein
MAEVTLEFLGTKIEQMLDRMGQLEDQFTVQTGILMRLEGRIDGLAAEVRGLAVETAGLRRLFERTEHRVRKLEDVEDPHE